MSEVKTNRTNRDQDQRLIKRLADLQEKKSRLSPEQIEQRKRIQAFRDTWANNMLPDLTKYKDLVPGYHVCWGTTESKVDPLEGRLQLGYTIVKEEDINPECGFVATTKMSSGKYEGAVSCNEMILLKLPEEMYQEIMTMMHHDDPLTYQRNITEELRAAAESKRGGNSILEGGLLDMEREAARVGSRPTFST